MIRFISLSIVLAVPAGAQVLRAPSVAVASNISAVPVLAMTAPALGSSLSASMPPLPASLTSVPSAAPAAAAPAADPKAALVEKLAARLCSADCVTRGKTAQWIGELALEHPREAVQAAAVRGLADDAAATRDLSHFEAVSRVIESIAAATPHEAVFDDAVRRMVDAARGSGQAQRARALASAERIGAAGDAARRARAAEILSALRADPAYRLDAEDLDRLIARVKGV